MSQHSKFSCGYLISGLVTGSLSLAYVATATVVPAGSATILRSLVPSFGVLAALLCVVASFCKPGAVGVSHRRQLFSGQLAVTCAAVLLIVVYLVSVVATPPPMTPPMKPDGNYRLVDEIVLGVLMTSVMLGSVVLGWLDVGLRGSSCNRREVASTELRSEQPVADTLALCLEPQGHRIAAANRNRRPPSGPAAASAAATRPACLAPGTVASSSKDTDALNVPDAEPATEEVAKQPEVTADCPAANDESAD